MTLTDLSGRAHRTVGSGGLCEKYRTAVEMDPSTSKYVQTKLSLNTGIVTFLNHMHFVSVPMASLTFAHELGHSLGSPVSWLVRLQPGDTHALDPLIRSFI
ncbi:hypothetical protein HPB48_026361 [Haemaphysalis longicornis]|uniref:Uncharacterized protein n=1 Tax=Haemaphysalis longicornis TaxID=44386 RepID=A0A9J6HB93_HAELO|nr:hypothetical protein HPB48_026361 [Haemaphysalis longicornis]